MYYVLSTAMFSEVDACVSEEEGLSEEDEGWAANLKKNLTRQH